jgi:uncharacterized protein YjbJ (UPF0337 family)
VATNRPTSKAKNGAHRTKGKVKQTVGRATRDDGMRARGIADEAVADLKEAAGKARTMVRDASEKAGEMARDVRDRLKR